MSIDLQIIIDKMPYVIAFSGTHGTGKSTAAKKLKTIIELKTGKSVVTIVDNISRDAIKFFPINQDATLQSQMLIFGSMLKAQLEAIAMSDIVICSRTIWDNIAYSQYQMEQEHNSAKRLAWEQFINGCILIAKNIKYDHILIPDPIINNFCHEDCIRDTNEEYRIAIHNEIVIVYFYNQVKTTPVKMMNTWLKQLSIKI